MRSTDEQLREIMRRSERVMEDRKRGRVMLAEGIASGVLLVLLAAVLGALQTLSAGPIGQTSTAYGSLLSDSPFLGYGIVCLLAFGLGVCVSLLCSQWKSRKERDRK